MNTRSRAYTDGSFNSITKKIGSGVVFRAEDIDIDGVPLPWIEAEVSVLLDTLNIRARKSGMFDATRTEQLISHYIKHGVSLGETRAVQIALRLARELESEKLLIYHDRKDLKLFSEPNNIKPRHAEFLALYAKECSDARKCMKVEFRKVNAHGESALNNRADELAKGTAISPE
jgi:hypothetical protein